MASTDPKTATQGQWEDLASKVKAANREILYGTCSTAAGTAAKVVSTTKGTFVLETGAMVRVKFTNANSYNGTATMAVDGTTAKNIVQKGTTTTTRYWWDAGEVVDFVYDGTNFVIVDGAPATTTYYGVTKLVDSDSSSSTATALVPNSLYTLANSTICPYYSSSSTYDLGDKVRYGKKLYKCTTAITTAEAWTAAHWTQIDPLQTQVDRAAFVGTDLGTASTVFVQTGNIADGAVTSAKLAVSSIIDIFYPVGSYYETSDTTFNPNTSWGGTWVEDSAGRVTVAKNTGTFSTVGASGGEETHALSASEIPSHNHPLQIALMGSGGGVNSIYGATFSASANGSIVTTTAAATSGEVRWGIKNNTGGDGSHNNLQPYIVVKRWHRTA